MNKAVILGIAMAIGSGLTGAELAIAKGEDEGTGVVGLADRTFLFGGTFTRGVSDSVGAWGEAYVLPGGTTSVEAVNVSGSAMLFGGGVSYNFKNTVRGRFVPYASGGIGVLRATARGSFGGNAFSGSGSSAYLCFGGGGRYYVNERWGIRPELMVYTGNGSFVRASVGLFYQF